MPQTFQSIDLEGWRAKLGATAPAPVLAPGGISIAPLYDAGPTLALPPREPGWACVQRVEDDGDIAAQCVGIAEGDVDALWLDARADGAPHDPATVDAVLAALPTGAHAIIDCAAGAEQLLARTELARVRQLGIDPARAESPEHVIAEALALRRRAGALRTWCCDGTPWRDAGADPALELAIVVAGALAAVRAGAGAGLDARSVVAGLSFRIGLRGDVLLDLAMLRAARLLWSGCARRLELADIAVPLHARSTRHLGKDDDVDTHLVRATLEGFAAAMGGADSLAIERHDLRGPAAGGARRWARNISHVLRGECGLARLDDPAAGAYAVESLTDALARAAWQRVGAIEAEGGLYAALPRLRAERSAT